MTPPPANAVSDSPVSAADSVFDAILADIVRGVYPPKSRLPAERELARTLGASRPTLREALGRLSEWNLVEARRGSGVVVREQREWSFEVLPAYLRYGPATREPRALTRMVGDLLALRRITMIEITRLLAGRVDDTGAIDRARDAVVRAWDLRSQSGPFAEADLEIMRCIIEAANFMPALWMLNRLASVYLEIARAISMIPPPADYVRSMETFIDALAVNDIPAALDVLRRYLESHDQRLLSALGAMA